MTRVQQKNGGRSAKSVKLKKHDPLKVRERKALEELGFACLMMNRTSAQWLHYNISKNNNKKRLRAF